MADKANYIKKKIKDLIPGDIILHPIYRSDGLVLMNREKLTANLIALLKKHATSTTPVLVVQSDEALEHFLSNSEWDTYEFEQDLRSVLEEYNITTDILTDIHLFMHNELHLNWHSDSNESFIKKSNIFSYILSNNPLWASLDSKLESRQLKARINKVKSNFLELLSIESNGLLNLFNIVKDYDDELFIHSINSLCLALLIGSTLELNNEELVDLLIAAAFSNIGFTDIPKEEFKNYLKIHEVGLEEVNRHLVAFSKIASTNSLLRKKPVFHGILDHHEYYDGKGYPSGKNGEKISLFGRILLITHTYDELVGGYDYTEGLHPLHALRVIIENKEQQFDENIISIFVARTNYFKLGATVLLRNKQKGEIIGFDNFIKAPHLPTIRLDNGRIINLYTKKIIY
ncbi:MAG: hypothetical protein M0T74_08800 [Desulfitobacterium hafniense]|nr:hypothetical protein [Desulfitobacterium hafniense]